MHPELVGKLRQLLALDVHFRLADAAAAAAERGRTSAGLFAFRLMQPRARWDARRTADERERRAIRAPTAYQSPLFPSHVSYNCTLLEPPSPLLQVSALENHRGVREELSNQLAPHH